MYKLRNKIEVRRFLKLDSLECELIVPVFRAQISNALKCLEVYKQPAEFCNMEKKKVTVL